MSDIQQKIQEERDAARTVCDVNGATSPECAVAWDVVEELQAEASHQKQKQAQTQRTSLERYCDDNPSADECRIYED
ncbi:Calvin cycle protein CP12 [Leptolyngbya sp. FACHB-261]|uniref:Calvin cycle protein CP12 n=1 Tax=Leptolyngbya sp. FACHB-261 TaxID=2692806 RepID=UPI0016889285|nr:Calvin cycle protein CP12 [Leptolyngbya sp. FACHB-261]MBD2104239.1 Calvin cycle protein CP12 [Leptolyngbya sp. FACHB-261]